MSYIKINEIKSRTRLDVFCMAVSYLLDKGYDYCVGITDEDISEIEGNGLMSAEFSQELVRTARDIAVAEDNNPIEIVQFCSAEDIFETEYYAGEMSRGNLEEIVKNAIEALSSYKGLDDEEIAEILGVDEEHAELIGLQIGS